ncbi:E3 ubiquitin-protein ligase RNF220-like [Physeter macrocephalus]|uniref:E3 ubiquitin-protein ligase RNF220-like n=1 Tax=Physeter macrocephalus TaxID=9755 RepID=A0A455AT15_PHYMC|nr:E3 ubiquitin-protein ligase RNF220-like [Physeter catodon]
MGKSKKKAAALFDSQAPICPICQVLLRPSELQEHMEQELEQLAQLPASKNSLLKDAMAPGTPKSLLLSASIKREGESPTASPHSSATDDLHHSDRYQVRRGGLGPWVRAYRAGLGLTPPILRIQGERPELCLVPSVSTASN